MIKYLLFIALLFSFSVNAQIGKRPLLYVGGGSPPPPPPPASGFNWDNLTPQSPTAYNNCGTVLVENKSFTNLNSAVLGGDNIQVGGSCNITFRNCYFGPSIRNGASVEGLSGTAKFVSCLFVSNKVGIEFSSSSGNIQIDSSQCINPWGAPLCKGQFVQFVSAGGSNSYIKNCAIENFRGEGATEDLISMFGGTGTISSYIQISDNLARGGGPSESGGGFIAGDGDGQYIVIERNKFYNPGNYIVAAAGGNNIIIRNNQGYQADNEVQNIATYTYLTGASSECRNITMTGNSMLLQNSNNYYCYCTPTCGDVIGVDESQGDPVQGWLQTNSNSLTLAQLAFPTTIITLVDADRLWRLREESLQFISYTNTVCCGSPCTVDPQYPRPTSNAGADQSITVSTAILNGSGSTSTDGFNYRWVQVSGPNTATMSAPLAVSNNLSGLANGTYEFRLEVTNNSGAADADWMTITVNVPTFYFNASTGDDSRTPAQAQNQSTPWQTLTKFNSYFSTLTSNAVVSFNRGDTFYGNMVISRSGLSAAVPITITAYGSGADPIITGLTSVTAWTNLGGNIWESTSAVSTLSTLNMVVINGVNTGLGRTPNSGYFTYQSHSTNVSITSTDVNSGVTNWTGAEAVIRKYPWVTDRNPITAHSGGTLTYSGGDDDGIDNSGFYIQNDVRTLDATNEWFYNTSTKKIRIYNTVSPTNVQVATVENLVTGNQFDNITFDNISFQGSNGNTIVVAGSANLVIQNCSIDFSGQDAIWGNQSFGSSCSGFILQNSTINSSNNNAIYLASEFTGALITNNNIQNIGLNDGMGAYYSGTKLVGMRVQGASTIVEYNTIENVGYNGIMFERSNVIVRNNFVNNFCTQKMDGAGIYTWWGTGSFSTYTGQKIYNNIILNGVGANNGTPISENQAFGIYLDDGIANVEVYGNTLANNSYSGLYLHNVNNINVHDNTFYNNGIYQQRITNYLSCCPTRNLTLLRNKYFAKESTQKAADYETLVNDLTLWGTAASINSNYYARPIDDNLTIRTEVNDGTVTQRTLAGWKAFSGYDALGNKSPQTITDVADLRFEYNATSAPVTVTLPFPYIDVSGAVYFPAITIPAYGSAVLIKQAL